MYEGIDLYSNPIHPGLLLLTTIEGFHVTSYPANFASHHTHDRHVGFLSPQSGIVKHNKMSQNFLFSSYQNTKLQPSDKNIVAHTLGWNLKSCYEVDQK